VKPGVIGLLGLNGAGKSTLMLGVLTSSRKPFEVIYVTWMYLILNAVPSLDFVGVTPENHWKFYTLSAFVLLALAVFIRHWRLTGGK
jgi:ABC-type multidrug transport system ATPase subunit